MNIVILRNGSSFLYYRTFYNNSNIYQGMCKLANIQFICYKVTIKSKKNQFIVLNCFSLLGKFGID